MHQVGDAVILHGGHFPKFDVTIDKRYIGYYTVQMMTAGEIDILYDTEAYHLEGHWYWFGFPGPRIRFGPAGRSSSWDHRYIAFKGPLVDEWLSRGMIFRQPVQGESIARETALFDRMLALARRTDRLGQSLTLQFLELILLEIQDRGSHAHSVHDQWLAQVLDECNRQGWKQMSYQAIASRTGVSLTTLRRRFKALTGLPIHEYVIDLKARRARELLISTDTPIKQIADQLGYSDVFHFTRQFAERAGVTPAAFRASRPSRRSITK